MEIASDADIRRRPPKAPAPKPDAPQSPPIPVASSPDNRVPIPGSTITREYKGRLLEVLVLDEGFEYAGETLKSLSGVAKRITGSHCNGYLFFNLKRGGDQSRESHGCWLSLIDLSLHGESQVRLDAAHAVDADQRSCVIDASTQVGRDINRLFTGFVLREFGPDSFRVHLVAQHDTRPHGSPRRVCQSGRPLPGQ